MRRNTPYGPGNGGDLVCARAARNQDGSKRQGTLSGCFRVGSCRTTITVDSNATNEPHVTATLTANVERLLALESVGNARP